MYVVNVSYGDVGDEPEMALTETLGTYKTLDDACEAAASKFDEIKERLCDDLEVRFHGLEASFDNYYVIYGYLNPELGYVDNEHYYMVSVVER